MRVKKIINEVMSSVTYVISHDGYNNVWLVDCGSVPRIMEVLTDNGVTGVLLTHTHYDHIYGLLKIKDFFPECKIYTNQAGALGLASPTLNLSKYFNDPIYIECNEIEIVKEGDSIILFPGIVSNVLETPGHCPSCLCFDIENYLFTGDSLIPGHDPVTKFHGSDKELARLSYERIQTLVNNHIVCAGHA